MDQVLARQRRALRPCRELFRPLHMAAKLVPIQRPALRHNKPQIQHRIPRRPPQQAVDHERHVPVPLDQPQLRVVLHPAPARHAPRRVRDQHAAELPLDGRQGVEAPQHAARPRARRGQEPPHARPRLVRREAPDVAAPEQRRGFAEDLAARAQQPDGQPRPDVLQVGLVPESGRAVGGPVGGAGLLQPCGQGRDAAGVGDEVRRAQVDVGRLYEGAAVDQGADFAREGEEGGVRLGGRLLVTVLEVGVLGFGSRPSFLHVGRCCFYCCEGSSVLFSAVGIGGYDGASGCLGRVERIS